MKTTIAVVALLGLAACQGGAKQTGIDLAQDAAAALSRNSSVAEDQAIAARCVSFRPAFAAGVKSSNKQLSSVASFGRAFCADFANGKIIVDPQQQSVAWLDGVLKGTEEAAQLAGIILPVVLPLL